jgi:hypothetical protein
VSKYEFIESQRAEHGSVISAAKGCRWLAESNVGFYHVWARQHAFETARRETLTFRVKLFESFAGTRGYRQNHADMDDDRTHCATDLACHLMRREARVASQPHSVRVTTHPDTDAGTDMST